MAELSLDRQTFQDIAEEPVPWPDHFTAKVDGPGVGVAEDLQGRSINKNSRAGHHPCNRKSSSFQYEAAARIQQSAFQAHL
jgi:hypothetical protein